MVYDQPDRTRIVNSSPGRGTGDMNYQTADGRWWKPWDGTVKTGEVVATMTGGQIKQ